MAGASLVAALINGTLMVNQTEVAVWSNEMLYKPVIKLFIEITIE